MAAPTTTPAPAALFARTGVRRTFIPILLTLSCMLPALGIGARVMPADSPLRMPTWGSAMLIAAGVITGVVAVLNMLAVRRAMRA